MVTLRTRLILLALLIAATGWQASPAVAAPVAAPAAAPLPQSAACAVAAAAAIAQQGDPYVWGAKGPNSFDCSGLTSYAWAQAGYNIGPSSYDQARRGVAIPCRLSDLDGESTTCWQAGDLIFLRYAGGQHVAMYVGNGLFADAYNSATGVIIHAVENDTFYQAHFWQARRIVDCGDVSVTVPSPDPLPTDPPGLEELPNILDPLSFVILQCGECNPDGSIILPPTTWSESWPEGFELFNVARAIQITISWLAWQISEIIRQLLCWLLAMLQFLANILELAVNALIFGVNSLFKMLVLLWLSIKYYFLAFWDLLEEIRLLLATVGDGLGGLAAFGQLIIDVIVLIASLIGRIILLLGQIALALIGVLGWLGGLVIGLFLSIQAALAGTVVPAHLGETHPIYRAVRGLLEGTRDSQIGWVFPVLWGMAYIAFVTWLSKFFSAGREAV